MLWKFARRINSANEQTVSRFIGWVIKLHGKENSRKTDRLSSTYKKSNYGVQYRVGMHYPISITYQSKQYEVHTLTADAGAAGKFFQVIWVSAVERLHTLHYAINKNMFDLRLEMWEEALRACFAMNKVNYARYGTLYLVLGHYAERHYAERHYAERHYAGKHYAEWTGCR